MKTCRKCGVEKPLADFHVRKDGGCGERPRSDCKLCFNRANLARYAADPHAKERHRWTSRRHALSKKYGLSTVQYEELLSKTAGRCEICDAPPLPHRFHHIDHDHTTGAVRGVLCTDCNRGLGGFRDDPELLARALRYLKGEL